MGFPSRSKIFAVFLGGIVFHRYFPWGDSSDMYVICGGSSGVVFGGRAG